MKNSYAKLSKEEREKLILGVLSENDALRGDNFKILSDSIDIIGKVDDALSVGEVAGLLARIPAIGAAAQGIGALSVFLFPAGSFISVVNAQESGLRAYGMRAIAYSATAWAFDKPLLDGSRRIMKNLQTGSPKIEDEALVEYKAAWAQARQQTVRRLTSVAVQYRTKNSAIKVLLRSIGSDNPQTLCLQLLRRFEHEMSGVQKLLWRSNYSVVYPK